MSIASLQTLRAVRSGTNLGHENGSGHMLEEIGVHSFKSKADGKVVSTNSSFKSL